MKIRSILFGLLCLASGAGLAVHIVAQVSLQISLALTVAAVVGSGAVAWRRLSQAARVELRWRAWIGVVVGVFATLAYDLTRFVTVRVGGLSFWPFDVFPIFGRLLLGIDTPSCVALAVGTVYHLINGISFAVAYTLVLGDRGWVAGLTWAMVLEVLMISLYPGWLNPDSLEEFLGISVLGHITYGIVLGFVSQRLLTRPGGRNPGSQRPFRHVPTHGNGS
jgi:hypothetical protein